MSRVILIAWDGADWRILDPQLEQGALPNLQALIDHAGSGSRLWPVPVKPAEVTLRALELAHLSPLAEWHYRTAHTDSFVSIDRAREALGWEPRLSNAQTLCATYSWYLEHLAEIADGTGGHVVGL